MARNANRTTLTKSLHTVTAVSRVALYINRQRYAGRVTDTREPAEALVREALFELGQPCDWPASDATYAACVAAVQKALAK